MLRFHFFTAKQGTWVHKDDRGPLKVSSFHYPTSMYEVQI